MNRTSGLLVVATLAMAAASPASATSLEVACDRAAILPAHTKPVAWEVTADGVPVAHGTAAGHVTVPLDLQGQGTVTLRAGSWSKPDRIGAGETLTRPYACPVPAPEGPASGGSAASAASRPRGARTGRARLPCGTSSATAPGRSGSASPVSAAASPPPRSPPHP